MENLYYSPDVTNNCKTQRLEYIKQCQTQTDSNEVCASKTEAKCC